MNWFYVDAGKQAGPVPDEQLDELVRSGKVRADTLVWREGLANWQPYSQARPEGIQAPAPAPPLAAAMAPGAPPPTAAMPGMTMPGAYGLDYAGFWIRFLAKIIDGLIIGVVCGIPIAIIAFRGVLSGQAPQPQAWVSNPFFSGPLQLASWAIMVLYNGFFLGKFGATPGKMALGLKVVTPDGIPVSYGRAFGRSAAEILSGLICYIGYIIAGFDAQKRALHDHMASTRVIKTRG